jgi:hypothetical protein
VEDRLARIIALPEGNDVNSVITDTKDGWEALTEILTTAWKS